MEVSTIHRVTLVLSLLAVLASRAAANILDTEPQTRNSATIATPESAKLEPFTGSSSYQYRFEVPPGTGGLTPDVALSYSSLTKGTEYGWGWKLNLSRIERSTRFGTPRYDDAQDQFEIDGELLVRDPTNPSTRFHKRHADFSRIQYFPNPVSELSYWEVTQPDGVRMRYGSRSVANSRLTNGIELAGPVFRWALDEVVDPRGNAYRVDYQVEFGPGAVGSRKAIYVYPRFIRYSFRPGESEGQVTSRARRLIVFDWGPRGASGEDMDRPTSFRSGFRVQITKRLVGVRIGLTSNSDGTFAPGEQVRRYALSYVPKFSSASLDRLRSPPFSELGTIQRYGSSDLPFPSGAHPRPTRFSYTKPQRYRDSVELEAASQTFDVPETPERAGNAIRFPFSTVDTVGGLVDLDGDGRVDRIRTRPNSGAREWIVNFGWPYNGTGDVRWLWCSSDSVSSCTPTLPTSVADRLTDVGSLDIGGGRTWTFVQSDLIDMDGDGLPDWVAATENGNWLFRKNLKDRFGKEQTWSPPALVISGSQQNAQARARFINSTLKVGGTYTGWSQMIDIDGDGKPDHVAGHLLDPNSMWFSRNHGCDPVSGCGFDPAIPIPGRVAYQPPPAAAPLSVATTSSLGDYPAPPNNVVESTHEILDINGDNLPDIVIGCEVGFGLGTGFQRRIPGVGYEDGLSDCAHGPNAALYATELQLNYYTYPPQYDPVAWNTLQDVNGDGIVDEIVIDLPGSFAGGPPITMARPLVRLGLGDGTFTSAGVPLDLDGSQPNFSESDYPYPHVTNSYPVRYGNPILTDAMDMDGDGQLDHVIAISCTYTFGQCEPGVVRWIIRSGAGPEGLLEKVETELGGTTALSYQASSLDLTFPPDDNSPLAVPRKRAWVVSRIAVDDGHSPSVVRTFLYSNPKYERDLRENRGFEWAESWDAASTNTTTHYNQDQAAGLPIQQDVVGTGARRQTVWDWFLESPKNEHGAVISGSYFPQFSRISETTYATASASSAKQTHSVSRTFDQTFGFMTIERDYGADGLAGTADDLSTVASFEPDIDRWLLRLPRSRYKQLGTATDEISRVEDEQLDYTNGLLTRRTTHRHNPLTASTDELEENWQRDEFGNVLLYWPPSRLPPTPTNAQVQTTWDSGLSSFPDSVTRRDGSLALATTYSFNVGLGQVTKKLGPRGYLECWDYDTFGRLTSKRDSPGGAASASADCSDMRSQFVFPDTSLGNPNTQYLTTLSVVGGTASLEKREYFDGLGRTYREANQAGATPTKDFFVTAKGWGSRGELSCQSEPIRRADPNVGTVTCGSNTAPSHVTQFDALLRPLQQILRMPAGSSTTDRLEEAVWYGISDHDGLPGNELVETHTVFGTMNLIREIAKDPRGDVVSVKEGDWTTYLRRDPKGRIRLVDGPDVPRAFQSPEPNLLALAYNSEGQRVRVGRPGAASDPNAPPYTTYSYNADGDLESEVAASGPATAITYTYDGLGRLRFKDVAPTNTLAAPGLTDTVYIYDSSTYNGLAYSAPGDLIRTVIGDVVTEVKRDLRGNLNRRLRRVGATSYFFGYYYDVLGRLIATTYPSPQGSWIARKYDGALLTSIGAPTTITELFSWTTGNGLGTPPSPALIDGITHHPSGALQGLHYTNGGVTTSNTFDPGDYRLSRTVTTGPAGTLQDLAYDYDAAGNVNTIQDFGGFLSHQYFYDQFHRLTGDWSVGTYAYPLELYGYDNAGNLTQKGNLTLSYGAAGGGPHGVSRAHDPATGFDIQYEYDENGNVRYRAGPANDYEQFGYTADNRMTTYAYLSGTGALGSATYSYDDSGARVTRVASKTGLSPENAVTVDPEFEIDVARGKTKRHVFVDGRRAVTLETPAGAATPVHQLQYQPDHLGTNRLVTDETGAVTQRAFTKAFGEIYKAVNGAAANLAPSDRASQYLFTGQHADVETSLDYFGARYFDPIVGRFTSVDGALVSHSPGATFEEIAARSVNLDAYAYSENNPINRVDPSGRQDYASSTCAGCDVIWGDPNPDLTLYYRRSEAVGGLIGSGIAIGGIYGGIYALPWLATNAELAAVLGYNIAETANPGPPMLPLGLPGNEIGQLVRGATRGAADLERGVSVLGHYPGYVALGERVGGRYFNVPMKIWEAMKPTDQWAANVRFLDRLIARGDVVLLATPATQARPGSTYSQELQYLLSFGYALSADGMRMLPPGMR